MYGQRLEGIGQKVGSDYFQSVVHRVFNIFSLCPSVFPELPICVANQPALPENARHTPATIYGVQGARLHSTTNPLQDGFLFLAHFGGPLESQSILGHSRVFC